MTTTNRGRPGPVEVRLEDVMAGFGAQMGRPRAAAPSDEGMLPSGTVIVSIADLEALFERVA